MGLRNILQCLYMVASNFVEILKYQCSYSFFFFCENEGIRERHGFNFLEVYMLTYNKMRIKLSFH